MRSTKYSLLIKETFANLFFALIIVAPIWLFVARPFIVHGASMYPSFNHNESAIIGDYLLVELISYRLNNPERGDVVVFKGDKSKGAENRLIKRLVGLPGETIEFSVNSVFITDKEGGKLELEEEYLNESTPIIYTPQTIKLKENEYFVLGDNRNDSFDSRFTGAIKEGDIIGKVFLRLFPFNQISIYPGK